MVQAGRGTVADVSDVCQALTTTVSRNAVSSVHPALSRRKRGSWPVTSVLEAMAMGLWVHGTSPPVQASVQQGTTPAVDSNLACHVLRAITNQIWDGPCAFPVGEVSAPSGKGPAPSTTVKSKLIVLQVITTTPQYTAVSAALWGPIRQSLNKTTASPVLEIPPLILMVPQVSRSARTGNVAGRWASLWVILSHLTILVITLQMWSAFGTSTHPASARS